MAQNSLAVTPVPTTAKPIPVVRVGFVGVGVKGTEHLANLLKLPGVELRAVCDIDEAASTKAQQLTEQAGQRKPKAYTRGDHDFERMCATEELDLVYTATPWEWHVPVCLAAMRHGKHAATEIPAAITLDECWQLVESSEKTGRYCCMMENVNYMREEMAILHRSDGDPVDRRRVERRRESALGGLGRFRNGLGENVHDHCPSPSVVASSECASEPSVLCPSASPEGATIAPRFFAGAGSRSPVFVSTWVMSAFTDGSIRSKKGLG